MWESEKTFKSASVTCERFSRQEARGSERYNHEHVLVNQLAFSVEELVPSRRSMRYFVIYDLVPTNVSLYIIHLMATESCSEYGATDTLMHPLTERGASADLWICTSALPAYFLSHNTSTDVSGVVPLPRLQNLAAPKTPNIAMLLCVHCILR